MSDVSEYGKWYIHGPVGNVGTRMRAHGFLLVITLGALFCMPGCLENEEGTLVTMTLRELIEDYNQSTDNNTKTITYWLMSLDDGDKISIRDTIENMTLRTSENESYTRIIFESIENQSLSVEGDATNDFENGDEVELNLHIINVTFTDQHPYTGETWTIHYEIFREGWDSENKKVIPIPRKFLSLA
jgi:hypothetical protein